MPTPASLPKSLLALVLAVWAGCGVWIVQATPFGSQTDESIEYVAFAAAKNRWADETDHRLHRIDHFYYPPLYYLAFAPFWGDEPSFVEGYPRGDGQDPNYPTRAGRRTVSESYVAAVPPPVLRLYRQAKSLSLALGLLALLALAATLRLLFPGPGGWWVVLLGTAPAALLPQFLFYQTLANNDALLNALAALATLAFVAAVLDLERGRERRFLALSLAVGACIGLAILTKMSAPVLFPLVGGLAWARWRADGDRPPRARARRALALLALTVAVAVLAGGWWIGYKAAQGDWNSFKAHRLAHPWAMIEETKLSDPGWWAKQSVQIVRTYYALFSGALGLAVPDAVIVAWLALPLTALAAGALAARFDRQAPAQGPAPDRGARRTIWLTLGALMLANAVSVLVNLRYFEAAYGRLLFPSLVATHAVAAAVLARLLRWRPRALAAAALATVIGAGALFAWTVRHRLGPAVAQPPEDVRLLGRVGGEAIGPIWASPIRQPLIVPPGDLVAFRVDVKRTNFVPQFGAALEGRLLLRLPDGRQESVPLRRTPLGDSDLAVAWTEIRLDRPVRLAASTPALLTLQGRPPAFAPAGTVFLYICNREGAPAAAPGAASFCAVNVAAVYGR